jgi:excinuclease ABC subunit C
MIGARDFEQRNTAGETDGYLYRNFIEQFYTREIIPAPELCCSRMPEDAAVLSAWLTERRGAKVRIMVPSRGIKRKLVSMAEENAEEIHKSRTAEVTQDVAEEITLLLGLKKTPESIGAFDISNITGTAAVGAFIYWENNSFNKSRYRHIRMDGVKGPDDYAMMKEMIRRTFKSAIVNSQKAEAETTEKSAEVRSHGSEVTEKYSIPDLVIIDGGREHLKAALEVLREKNIPELQVVGLAKDPDRIYLENHEEPVFIDDSKPSSLLLRRIRDEVHRFAVRYHRKQRSKKAFESLLDKIYGMGRARRFALLQHFGSIDAIKKASVDDIAGLKGFSRKLAQEVITALGAEEIKGEPT